MIQTSGVGARPVPALVNLPESPPTRACRISRCSAKWVGAPTAARLGQCRRRPGARPAIRFNRMDGRLSAFVGPSGTPWSSPTQVSGPPATSTCSNRTPCSLKAAQPLRPVGALAGRVGVMAQHPIRTDGRPCPFVGPRMWFTRYRGNPLDPVPDQPEPISAHVHAIVWHPGRLPGGMCGMVDPK